MKPKVEELTAAEAQNPKVQALVRPFVSRTADSTRGDDGVSGGWFYVTAKTLEIRDLSTVTCSGNARDNRAYIALLDELRKAPEVSDLKTEMERGQSPVQFTLNFQWEGGKSGGN